MILLVEPRKEDGFWKRPLQAMVNEVEALKADSARIDKLEDADWRAELAVGGLCDHKVVLGQYQGSTRVVLRQY